VLKIKRLKGIGALLVLIFAIFMVGVLSGCETSVPYEQVPAEAAQAQPPSPSASAQASRISAGGVVESVLSRNVYSALGFFIEDVNVEVGDRVTEGQVLAVLDTEDLELTIEQAKVQLETARISTQRALEDSQRLHRQASTNLANNTNQLVLAAESALRAAESNLTAIRSNYEAARQDSTDENNSQVLAVRAAMRNAEIELGNAERDLESAKLMYEIGGISQMELRLAEDAVTFIRNQLSDARASYANIGILQQRAIEQLRISLDAAETAVGQARSALNAARNVARQEIELLGGAVEQAELATNFEAEEIAIQIMERRLEDSKIISPIDGVVTHVIAREGMVGTGLMFVIENTDDLRVITSFREYDIGMLSEGMEVRIISDAVGSEDYLGVISRINPAAANQGIPGSVVEFEAEVSVVSESTSLRIGMNVRVSVEGG